MGSQGRSWGARVRKRVATFGRTAWRRLRRNGDALLLAATAAGISYFVAQLFFVGGRPFFAPIAAVVVMGLAAGQRIRRAFEIVVGVALGLLAADLFIETVGSGPLQLAGAVLLASTLAVVLLGAGNLMSNQAAIAAVLVMALMPVDPNPFGPAGRLLEALIGGTIALALNIIFSPDPLRAVHRTSSQIITGLDNTLVEICTALTKRDLDGAERALESTDDVARHAQRFDESINAARESARLARYRRGVGAQLKPIVTLRARLDILISTMRGLARAAANAVRYGHEVPADITVALEELSSALQDLDKITRNQASPAAAQGKALEAARIATGVLQEPHHLTASVMVGQIRSAAVDILRATGVLQGEAIRQLEATAGRADRPA